MAAVISYGPKRAPGTRDMRIKKQADYMLKRPLPDQVGPDRVDTTRRNRAAFREPAVALCCVQSPAPLHKHCVRDNAIRGFLSSSDHPSRMRHDMMQLEKAGLVATPLIASECTSTSIAVPHFTLDRCRHASRTVRHRSVSLSWPIGSCPPSLRQIREKQRERAIENDCRIDSEGYVAGDPAPVAACRT